MMKIYIAGPYTAENSAEIENNVYRAIDLGIKIYKMGHIPYIPHLTHWIDIRSKETNQNLQWGDYMIMDDVWLESCDGLLYLGSSKGADIELERAKKLGKKIFYSIDQLSNQK